MRERFSGSPLYNIYIGTAATIINCRVDIRNRYYKRAGSYLCEALRGRRGAGDRGMRWRRNRCARARLLVRRGNKRARLN